MINWNVLTDKDRQNFANYEYQNKIKIGQKVDITGHSNIGTVVDKFNNSITGSQAYAVSNSPKGTPNNKIKNIAILYKGSSGEKNKWDTYADWGENDIPAGIEVLLHAGVATPQMDVSALELKNILKKYPNAKISVYGHSLGSMDAQFALAALRPDQLDRIKDAYMYEGPNIYSLLNPFQKGTLQLLEKRNHHINNYVDPLDAIALGYFEDGKSVGRVSVVASKWSGNPILQHMWGGYVFDKNGKLKISHVIEPSISIVGDVANVFAKGLLEVSNQAISLKDAGLIALANKIASEMEDSMEAVVKSCNKAIDDCQTQWRNVYNAANDVGSDMSESEIKAALSAVGCTKHSIVTEPSEQYHKKSDQAKKLVTKFQEISKKLKENSETLKQADHKAGGIFN
ncbi:alpha/beta hydrolase family protein [Bombilactobacillus thymidiniphilus]|uniref:DUF2974 domain-containing protein n=1 Tax=Bombilactobacillus thymidiniphilus TaxID=2923363 RepID=A0ABY4PFG0_9LACO|nr:hypothetical protein [Bombilactobacillus thymidiniphilus]UQS84261.1 hypothetical protein MOO47_03680 [Bombilactobacillus thymidiniphilus]